MRRGAQRGAFLCFSYESLKFSRLRYAKICEKVRTALYVLYVLWKAKEGRCVRHGAACSAARHACVCMVERYIMVVFKSARQMRSIPNGYKKRCHAI